MRRGLWPAHPASQHAWNRGGVWDAYFAVVLAATLLIVFSTSGPLTARLVEERSGRAVCNSLVRRSGGIVVRARNKL